MDRSSPLFSEFLNVFPNGEGVHAVMLSNHDLVLFVYTVAVSSTEYTASQ